MANSLATTVATPAKWVGRRAPSSGSDTSATDTVVSIGVGYISSTPGVNSTSTPALSASPVSRSRSRGYFARSSPSPNCNGFTKIDATTTWVSVRARRMRETWPSWSEPMVGTNPTRRPTARSPSSSGASSAIVVIVFMSRDPARFRPRPQVAPDGGLVAPRRRSREGARGPEGGHVLDGRPGQIEIGLERRADALAEPLHLAEQRHQVVGRNHRGGVVPGPVGVVDLEP